MENTIKTASVAKDFAKTDCVLLEQTADTALVFSPEIHPGGVRGNLVRFKRVRNETWEEMNKEDFRKLKLHEGAHIELKTAALEILCNEVNKRKAIVSEGGILYGKNEYTLSGKDSTLIINDENIRNILQQILNKNYSDNFWSLLEKSDFDLANKLSAGHLQLQRKKIIEELKNRLKHNYPETIGADSWQNWIYKHSWLFGANYREPIEKQRINISGIMPDYLFPTIDNFVDVLEIKLPTMGVIEEDPSHAGSWVWTKDSSRAIGQVVNYLSEIERLRLEVERSIKQQYSKDILMLKPRAYILIGESEGWSDKKKEGLRKLNHALHGVEIITYSDLVKRGESFIEPCLSVFEE